MGSLTGLVLLLVLAAGFQYVLSLVVRTAVEEGVRMALRLDPLDQRALGGTDAT